MERLDTLCAVLGEETRSAGAERRARRRRRLSPFAPTRSSRASRSATRSPRAEKLATHRRAPQSAAARERATTPPPPGTLLANLPPGPAARARTRLRELRHALETRGLERQNAPRGRARRASSISCVRSVRHPRRTPWRARRGGPPRTRPGRPAGLEGEMAISPVFSTAQRALPPRDRPGSPATTSEREHAGLAGRS